MPRPTGDVTSPSASRPASPEVPRALVTGGARMGGAIGQALASRGYAVAFSAHRSLDALRTVVADLAEQGHHASVIQADLRDPQACQTLVTEAMAGHGRLDVLVCLASTFERVPFDEVTPDVWRAHLAVDLDATFHCARAAAAVMRPRHSGRIILSADWVAASGRPRYAGYLPYFVAKAGIIGLTSALALELSADGISVNAIAPGPILPAAGTAADQQAAVLAATPLGCWGTPDAVAHTVGALVDATFVTGEVVRVDGGRARL